MGEERGEAAQIEQKGDWMWGRLAYPKDTIPKGDWRGRAMRHIKKHLQNRTPDTFSPLYSRDQIGDTLVLPGTTWTQLGPTPLDSSGSSSGYKYGTVSGRVNAIAFQPGSSSVAYMAPVVGGVWKTANCCSSSTTWSPLWDASTFPNQSVGAIAIDSVNTNIVYVGTGDSQVPGHGDGFSNGVFKSTDGGTTWKQYGADVFTPYVLPGAPASTCCTSAPDENVKVIGIDPNNHNTIIAGASYGVFISRDAGVNWTRYDVVDRNSSTYNDDSQMVSGLLIDSSTNPSTLYVAIGYPYESTRRVGLKGGANGVYKAAIPASGAPTFTLMNTGWPAGTGSGTPNSVGRIELDWNAAHTRIYALVSDYVATTTSGIYTTANGGTSWSLLSGTGDSSFTGCGADSNQDWYDYYLGVDPNDDHTLYVGRVNLWKIVVNAGYTGSSSVTNLSAVYGTACAAYGKCHPDQHAIAFQPGSNPSTFLAGNDGGIYFATGAVGGFTQLNGTVNSNEFYAGQLGRDFANTGGSQVQYAFGGMQDNGNASWDSSKTNLQWTARSVGGDGFFASFEPISGTNNAGRWITEYTPGVLSCSTAGASGGFAGCSPNYGLQANDRQDWSTPFLLDQWNCTTTQCNNLVLGSTVVWASTTAGSPVWTKTGSTDLTKNNGRYSQIISIDVAHSNPGSVIIGTGDGNVQWSGNVFTGATCTNAAANTATFACVANAASTWVNLTGSNAVLPNRSIGGVSFDPGSNTIFYAAVAGFNANTPSTPGHVFRGVCSSSPCTTGNITWTDKTGLLPDIPFESVIANPNSPNQVFAGSWLGFFYTNDITQNPPIWYRYMSGMPNTRVQFLTVDRGKAATPRTPTTLAAFTYGRGLYAVQVNLPVCSDATPNPSATPGCSGIALNWASVPGVSSYNVLRGSSCSSMTQLALGVAGTTYNDTSVTAGTNYYYQIQSSNSCGLVSSACIGPYTTSTVAAPTGVSVTPSCTGGTFTWTNGAGATSHNVLRYDGACPSSTGLVTSTGVSSGFTDSTATAGSSYCYVVQAQNSCGTANAAGITVSAIGTNTFHLQVQASGIGSYKSMGSASFEGSVQQQATASVTGAGEYQIGSTPVDWISSSYGQATNLALSAWTFDVYGLSSSAALAGQLYAKVYRYNSGSPVLLFTSGYASTNVSSALSQTRFTWNYTPAGGTVITSGDRLIVEIWLHATAGSSGGTVNDLVASEINNNGTVTGTFTNTQACDSSSELVKEKKIGTARYLDWVWAIPLTTGTAHTVQIVASSTSATNMRFEWGTASSGPWTTMFNSASSMNCVTPQTFSLPSNQTGTIYIHAVTINNAADAVLDTLTVDSIRVATTTPPPTFTLNFDHSSADSLVTAPNCASASVAPKRVPNGASGTTPAKWSKNDATASNTTCTWDVSSCSPSGSQNYNMIYGWGSGLSTYTLAGSACGIGTSGTFNWSTTPSIPGGETLMWWVIVESDGSGTEGSWGTDSSSNERKGTTASGVCGNASRTNLTCP